MRLSMLVAVIMNGLKLNKKHIVNVNDNKHYI